MSEHIYFGDDYIALNLNVFEGVEIYHPFDTSQTVEIPFDRWEDIKSAIDKQYAEYKKSSEQEKRQSIKKQTLHEIHIDGERIEEVNNPETGEKARLIVKNSDDVVSIDNYLNAKYLFDFLPSLKWGDSFCKTIKPKVITTSHLTVAFFMGAIYDTQND